MMNIPLLRQTPEIEKARSHWQFRGQARPPFAAEPKEGESSVWDFPRPPVIEDVPITMIVRVQDQVIAKTDRGRRVLETAGAPTYYFPPEDVLVPEYIAAALGREEARVHDPVEHDEELRAGDERRRDDDEQ